jgi:Uma2 family endonuclease
MTTLIPVSKIPVSKPISQLQLEPGSRLTIPAVTWEEFEAILQDIGEHRAARIAYSHHTLEITVPRPDHELPTDLIGDIVKTMLRLSRMRYQPFGSTTFKQQGLAGIEPDACFYIQNYERMIGRRQLQPEDPPPDLAIVTDVTSRTTLEAYRAIAVPELWIYTNSGVKSGGLKIYLLQDGEYVESDISAVFPQLPVIAWVNQAVEQAWTVGSLQALEGVEDQLRNLLGR